MVARAIERELHSLDGTIDWQCERYTFKGRTLPNGTCHRDLHCRGEKEAPRKCPVHREHSDQKLEKAVGPAEEKKDEEPCA